MNAVIRTAHNTYFFFRFTGTLTTTNRIGADEYLTDCKILNYNQIFIKRCKRAFENTDEIASTNSSKVSPSKATNSLNTVLQ